MPDGYYDEDGYWHREPSRERAPPKRRPRRNYEPIKDPYYDEYKDQYVDPYGRRVAVRRTVRRPQYRRVTTSKLGMFSGQEIKDIIIATLVLALAFTFVLGRHILLIDPVVAIIIFLPPSLLATVTAFTGHELAHKFMAQKHGLPAEFVINPIGILVALATALLIGFLFALPGAVVFSGAGADRKIVGKVGAAGPAVNILIAVALYPMYFQLDPSLIISYWIFLVIFINLFLGGFNLIPFGQFDGLKVWRWSPGLFILMFAAVIALIIPLFISNPIF